MILPWSFLIARRTRSALAAVVLSFGVLGCGASQTLRVATSGDYPPFSVATTYGAIVGFDTDVAAEFTHDTGRGVYFVPLRWLRLSEDADARTFDVAMSGITVRSDRLPHMLFSRPYAVTGAVIAVRREKMAELGTLEQIDRPGVRLAVNRGGHLEQVARRHFRYAKVLTVDDNRTLPDRVLRDEVDGAVSEELEVAAWPVDAFAVVGPFTRDRKAYAATLDGADLLRELNEWLAARERDGWLNGQRGRWLSPASAWSADEACFEAIASAIDLRLLLMPQVAAAKQQRNLPIEDPVQEANVLQQAADWAASANVEPSFVVALFERLIAAAKDAQKGVDARAVLLPDANIDSLRAAVAFYSRSLVEEIGRCRRSLSGSEAKASLEAALRRGEAFGDKAALAAELAEMLAHPDRIAPAAPVEAAVAQASGTFVEFCIPPNLRFDREGYSVEEMVDGMPLPGRRFDLPSGRTRVAVSGGRHEYRIYVNGSTADPWRSVVAGTPASAVDVWIPPDHVVSVRFTPTFKAAGEFELRWQDVYGAAAGGMDAYRGLTRFDVAVEVSAPAASAAPSQCPW